MMAHNANNSSNPESTVAGGSVGTPGAPVRAGGVLGSASNHSMSVSGAGPAPSPSPAAAGRARARASPGVELPLPATTQQKRHNSNSFPAAGASKRSVTNPKFHLPAQHAAQLDSTHSTAGSATPSLPYTGQPAQAQLPQGPLPGFSLPQRSSPAMSDASYLFTPFKSTPLPGYSKKKHGAWPKRPLNPLSPQPNCHQGAQPNCHHGAQPNTQPNTLPTTQANTQQGYHFQQPSLQHSQAGLQQAGLQQAGLQQAGCQSQPGSQPGFQAAGCQSQPGSQPGFQAGFQPADSPGSTASDGSNATAPPNSISSTSSNTTNTTAATSNPPQPAACANPPAAAAAPHNKLTEQEQALILKLQDTYKTIIRLETDLQKKCASLNLPQRLDMTELWDIYNVNLTLLNAYYDFLLYALTSGKSGKQIVQVYRIPRRLWVYGIVTFLDVLKNILPIFIEHDICSSFIGYAFNILSGLIELDMAGWLSEKLGDLSRMAVALYSSKYIDWKASAEHWYTRSLEVQYGIGKVYYHIATVQQDNLDALMNIGKSVFCRDTFVPTPEYMRMVIENINQRNFVDLPVLDFIKIHKILLSGEFNTDLELIKLVSYYSQNIGIDNKKVDFFVRNPSSSSAHPPLHPSTAAAPHALAEIPEDLSGSLNQDLEFENKLHFWFQRGSSFALVNICQVVGFGHALNPFASLFGLPEALRERRDKKDKKERRKRPAADDDAASSASCADPAEPTHLASDDWFHAMDHLNKNAIELAMRMFANYLNGPIIASTPHVITHLYFLVAVGEAICKKPSSRAFFESLVHAILPINSLIGYLNELLANVRLYKTPVLDEMARFLSDTDFIMSDRFLRHFCRNEALLEVWKCWGTLWFDTIEPKHEYLSFRDAGLVSEDLLDVPIGGCRYSKPLNVHRFARILLLATYIADNFNFGLKRSHHHFAYYFNEPLIRSEASYTCFRNFTRDTRILGLSENVSADRILGQQVEFTSNLLDWLRSDTGLARPAHHQHHDELPEPHDDDLGSAMDSSFTHFVMDTNMWLKHCGRLYKCIKSDIFKVAVPLIIFQELRVLRRSPDGNTSDAATRAVIIIRQLYLEEYVLALRLNGTEASSLNETDEFESPADNASANATATPTTNWMNDVDERILQCCKLYNLRINSQVDRNSHPLAFGILITDDRNLRLRARSQDIPSYQSRWFTEVLDRLSKGRCND